MGQAWCCERVEGVSDGVLEGLRAGTVGGNDRIALYEFSYGNVHLRLSRSGIVSHEIRYNDLGVAICLSRGIAVGRS